MSSASLTDPVRDARNQVVSDLQKLATHAQDLIEATRSLPGEGVALAREKLESSVADVRTRLEQLPQTVARRSREALALAEAQVRERPRESIAVTALVGLALGWLSRRGASASPNHLARYIATTIAGTAATVLWSSFKASQPVQAESPPEEIGRWESEGGSAPSVAQ